MKKKPDLSSFLEGGAADMANRSQSQAGSASRKITKPAALVGKMFRFREETANALKLGAAQASIASGRRVTETEIVENLIRQHYNLEI